MAIAKHSGNSIKVLRSFRDKGAMFFEAGEDQSVSCFANVLPILGLEGWSVHSAIMKRNPDRDARGVPVVLGVCVPVKAGILLGYEVPANGPDVGEASKSIYRKLYGKRPVDKSSREKAVAPNILIRRSQNADLVPELGAGIGIKNRTDMNSHAEVLH